MDRRAFVRAQENWWRSQPTPSKTIFGGVFGLLKKQVRILTR